MKRTTKLISVLTLLTVVVSSSSLRGQTTDPIRTVALSFNGPAPGSSSGNPFADFGLPSINDLGQTAFFAEVGLPSTEGLFSEGTPTGLSQLFEEGEFVPNSGGTQTLDSFLNVTQFSNSGQTLNNVGGRLSGLSPPRLLLRASSSSDLDVAVDIFGSISGASGPSIITPTSQNLRLNDSGEVSFTVLGPSSSAGVAIFSETGGQGFRQVVGENDILQASQVAGLSQDILLTTAVNLVGLNDASQNLFSSTFSTGTAIENGLFLEDAGVFSVAATTGVNVEPGISLDRISDATLNNQGQTVFQAGLGGATVSFANDSALVGNVGGSLEILVREGDAAPGTTGFFAGFGPGSSFAEELPVLGNGGDTVFVSAISGAGGFGFETGLFRVDELGTVELIAQEGVPVSGLPAGTVIDNFSAPSINENGQVAFQAILDGSGVTFANDVAIFAEDINGNLQLIAREGDLLNVSDDPNAPDFRVIDDLGFFGGSGSGDGTSSGFNELGQVAFHADLDVGGGIFVSSLVVAVPEPSSFFVLLFGASVCLTRRSRR